MMNDGNRFLENDGTIVYPPRGKDNPYYETEIKEWQVSSVTLTTMTPKNEGQ